MTNNPIVKGKLVCVALNDSDQFEAMQAEFGEAPYKSAPTQPVLYFKPQIPGVLKVLKLSGLLQKVSQLKKWSSEHLWRLSLVKSAAV